MLGRSCQSLGSDGRLLNGDESACDILVGGAGGAGCSGGDIISGSGLTCGGDIWVSWVSWVD